MVISHRHRFVYSVIPKCGSATIRTSLASYFDEGWPVNDRLPEHATLAQITALRPEVIPYFKFSFVRNPYDRLYSGYLQDQRAAERSKKWRVKRPLFEGGCSFKRYLLDYVAHADTINDWQWICFTPMTEFTHVGSICVMDFIGRAETLDADLATLSTLLHIDVPHINPVNVREGGLCTVEPKYLSQYDAETIEFVNTMYASDFTSFGYATA